MLTAAIKTGPPSAIWNECRNRIYLRDVILFFPCYGHNRKVKTGCSLVLLILLGFIETVCKDSPSRTSVKKFHVLWTTYTYFSDTLKCFFLWFLEHVFILREISTRSTVNSVLTEGRLAWFYVNSINTLIKWEIFLFLGCRFKPSSHLLSALSFSRKGNVVAVALTENSIQ